MTRGAVIDEAGFAVDGPAARAGGDTAAWIVAIAEEFEGVAVVGRFHGHGLDP